MKAEKGKLSDFDFDKRVRERHLVAGVLDAKVVERYLAELPDLEAFAEPLPFEQPALSEGDDDDDGPLDEGAP